MAVLKETDADLAHLAQALLELIRQEKNLPPNACQLLQSGAGGIAIGPGAMAGGERSVVVKGDLTDSRVFTGDIYIGSAPADDAQVLSLYRQMLVRSCRALPLRGVDVGASDPTSGQKRLELDQVYVALDTTAPLFEEKPADPLARPFLRPPTKTEERRLSDLEATIVRRRLVLQGDPGSGKSTFLSHLCLCLSAHGLDPEGGWLKRWPDWPRAEAQLLPITIILRDFVRTLPEKPGQAEPSHVWKFVVSYLEKKNLPFAAEPLRSALENGHGMFLFDGLDEIPSDRQRKFVRDAVAEFAGCYPKCRVLVTCRTLSYQNREWQLPDFQPFTLAPFDEIKIDRFITAWFHELQRLGTVKGEATETLARGLQTAVRRPDLWRLAPNPLLLTVMALVHTHKGQLPEARALLYEETVDILLWRWEQIKLGGEEQPGSRFDRVGFRVVASPFVAGR